MENVNFKDIVNQKRHSGRSDSELEESDKSKTTEGSHNVISNACERSQLINQETRNTHINIGTGKEISIKQLAETIKNSIGYHGALYFNTKKPDGTLRKLTDSSKLHKLGWKHKIELEDGIKTMYEWYLNN